MRRRHAAVLAIALVTVVAVAGCTYYLAMVYKAFGTVTSADDPYEPIHRKKKSQKRPAYCGNLSCLGCWK